MMKNVCEDNQWSRGGAHMEQLLPMFRVTFSAVFPGDKGMDVPSDAFLDKMRFVYWDCPFTRDTHGWELRLFLYQMGLN
jgi:hypothetical protein